MTLNKICANYGLTPEGVEFALSQYQKIICEITHGMLSKLTYEADRILEVAQERWCNTCELKEAQEPVKAEIGKNGCGSCWYICPECRFPIAYNDMFCRYCGRRLNWDD